MILSCIFANTAFSHHLVIGRRGDFGTDRPVDDVINLFYDLDEISSAFRDKRRICRHPSTRPVSARSRMASTSAVSTKNFIVSFPPSGMSLCFDLVPGGVRLHSIGWDSQALVRPTKRNNLQDGAGPLATIGRAPHIGCRRMPDSRGFHASTIADKPASASFGILSSPGPKTVRLSSSTRDCATSKPDSTPGA